MKNAEEVLTKLASLVQSHIATASGQERFVAATSGAGGLYVTAQDEDGVRKQYRISATLVDDTPHLPESTGEETACDAAGPTQDEPPAEADPPTDKDSQPCEGTAEPGPTGPAASAE